MVIGQKKRVMTQEYERSMREKLITFKMLFSGGGKKFPLLESYIFQYKIGAGHEYYE